MKINVLSQLCQIVVVLCFLQTSTIVFAADDQYENLIQSAYSNGVIRVSIQLDIPYELDAKLADDAAREAQQNTIEVGQKALIEFLQKRGATIGRVFSRTPYVIAEVDGPTLELLIKREGVLYIEADQVSGLAQ